MEDRPTWVIYYDDHSTFSSLDGTWEQAPADGVLYVLELVGDRIITHSGNDYYPMLEDSGTVAPTGDLGPFLRKLGTVKFGRYTTHKIMEEVSRRVAEDANKWQQ